MARPTKLTEETQTKIITAIKLGMRFEDAASVAGIALSTFYDWKARGEKAKSGKFKQFSEALKKAEAEGEQMLLARIQKAGREQWQANAWILERRHRAKWGRNVDVTSGGEKIEIEFAWKDANEDD